MSTEIDELTEAIEAFSNLIKNLPDGPQESLPDSDKFNGKSFDDMNTEANTPVNTHSANTTNPHGVKNTDIQVYTVTETDNRINTLIPQGLIRIDYFDGNQIQSTATIQSQFFLNIPGYTYLYYANRLLSVPSLNLNFTSYAPTDDSTVTVYVYLAVNLNGGTTLQASFSQDVTDNDTSGSTDYLRIGTVEVKQAGIESFQFNEVTRIAGQVVSDTNRPHAIPVSDNIPANDATATTWMN